MGLIVSVYRNAESNYDCTNGGISSRFTRLTLINVEGPFEPTANAPAALLLSNHFNTVRIVPADENGEQIKGWTMFGGNYASTSDSRFGEAVEKINGIRYPGAVPIHDRIE